MDNNKKEYKILGWIYNISFLTISVLNILGFDIMSNPYTVLSRFCLFIFVLSIAMMLLNPVLIEISYAMGNTIMIKDTIDTYAESITKKKTTINIIFFFLTIIIFWMNKQYELIFLRIIVMSQNRLSRDLYGKRLAEVIENGGVW